MIHAYDKVYLEKARTSLGRMLDFAVYELGYDLTAFFNSCCTAERRVFSDSNVFSPV